MARFDGDLSFDFRSPVKTVYAPGAARQCGAEAGELKCERVLLVTDPWLAENTDLPARVQKALGRRYAATYTGVKPDAETEGVNEGANAARECGADGVVTLGGGSAIDTGKGIALLMKMGGGITDHMGVNLLTEPVAPHIVIPTTAGTGSECTNVAVIKDNAQQRKLTLLDNYLYPDTAILDPELTLGLPAPLTAATGMDALTHAVEAIHSTLRNPFSDAYALNAVRLITERLRIAVQEPDDLESRGMMLIAASQAGVAFSNAMVAVVHALAHSIGALCGVHHGLANSILLPHGMRFNAQEEPGVYKEIAKAMDVYEPGMDDTEADEAAAAATALLAEECGLATTLAQAGVPEERLPEIAEHALSDGSILYNPRLVASADELLSLLKKAG